MWMQAEIEGMQDAARARDTEEGFQVSGMIPHHRSDAVTRLQSDGFERSGKFARPAVELTVARADDRLVRPARKDFDIWKQLACPLQNRRQRELKIHHGTAHNRASRKCR